MVGIQRWIPFWTLSSRMLEKWDKTQISSLRVETHPGLSHPSRKGEAAGVIYTHHLFLFRCLFPLPILWLIWEALCFCPDLTRPEVDKFSFEANQLFCSLSLWIFCLTSDGCDLSMQSSEKIWDSSSGFLWKKSKRSRWAHLRLRFWFKLSSLLEVGTKTPANDKVPCCIFWACINRGNLMNKYRIWVLLAFKSNITLNITFFRSVCTH